MLSIDPIARCCISVLNIVNIAEMYTNILYFENKAKPINPGKGYNCLINLLKGMERHHIIYRVQTERKTLYIPVISLTILSLSN